MLRDYSLMSCCFVAVVVAVVVDVVVVVVVTISSNCTCQHMYRNVYGP